MQIAFTVLSMESVFVRITGEGALVNLSFIPIVVAKASKADQMSMKSAGLNYALAFVPVLEHSRTLKLSNWVVGYSLYCAVLFFTSGQPGANLNG